MPTVRALWTEIETWFRTHDARANLAALRAGAPRRALAGLERTLGAALPAELRQSLAIHDGGGWFGSYELFGTRQIAATWRRWTRRELPPRRWDRRWIPFAEDSAGNLAALDPVKRRLLAIEVQAPAGVTSTARRTFAHWLHRYAQHLRDGTYVVDEAGQVGEPTPARVQHPDELAEPLASKLAIAAIRDQVATLRKALDAGTIHARSRTAFGTPLLTDAARHGARRTVELLLARGADVNIAAGDGDRNPLIAACASSTPDLAMIELLLEAGADPRTERRPGLDAIGVAASYRQPAVVALLERYLTRSRGRGSRPRRSARAR